MRLPSKAIYWTAAGLMVLATVILIWINQRGQTLLTSLESGIFEKQYLSEIQNLHDEIFAIKVKLHGNNPAELDIPQQELIESLKPTLEVISPGIPEKLVLSGIYLSETVPLAQINGKLCKVGDSVNGFTLEYIDSYQIRLRDRNGDTKKIVLDAAKGGTQ